MSLREVKKEVECLPNIKHSLEKLEENWIKASLPFLEDLNEIEKEELQQKIAALDKNFEKIKTGQEINEKLRHYAKYLIELKLTTFNGDENKSIIITNRLLNDDYLKLQQTIEDINLFKTNLEKFSNNYKNINIWLEQRLTLEHSLMFNELNHKLHFQTLMKTLEKQKTLIKKLGTQFVDLTRKTRIMK
tara:strand:+ start:710 stop:1276 length:567 start_codon:yes stop_codon:yes gene_type:complete